MNDIEVIGIGAMNLDRLYRVERILSDGEASVEEQVLAPGGSAANTIYGLAKLGIKTGFVGAIGDDKEGQTLLKDFQNIGVDTSQIKIKKGLPTGSALCLVNREGKRAVYVSPGANGLLNEQDISLEYLNQAKVVHLSSFTSEEHLALQKKATTSLSPSVMVSFAPGALYAAKGIQALAPLLKRTHILFINRDEIEQMTGLDFLTGAQRCLQQGCRIVAITLGAGIEVVKPSGKKRLATCYVNDGEREHFIKPEQISKEPAVDTTGAGDAFIAGFLYGLLQWKDLDKCGLLGDLVARFCITQLGARAGLPSLDELSQRYQERYRRPL